MSKVLTNNTNEVFKDSIKPLIITILTYYERLHNRNSHFVGIRDFEQNNQARS